MPEGYFGFTRLTELGPLVESDDEDGILIVDDQLELSKDDDLVYHVAEKDDIPSIIEEGLRGDMKSYEERNQKEMIRGIKAGRLLEEALNEAQNVADSAQPRMDASDLPNREDAVFFFPTVRFAAERASSLDEPIIVAVNSREIPCIDMLNIRDSGCAFARIDIADELFELYYNQAKEQAPVDREKEQELANRYWETARLYIPGDTGTSREIFCECNIPPDAIVEITKRVARLDSDIDIEEDLF